MSTIAVAGSNCLNRARIQQSVPLRNPLPHYQCSFSVLFGYRTSTADRYRRRECTADPSYFFTRYSRLAVDAQNCLPSSCSCIRPKSHHGCGTLLCHHQCDRCGCHIFCVDRSNSASLVTFHPLKLFVRSRATPALACFYNGVDVAVD